ncbi:tail assembly protein [Bordetella sp. LUAb4]|uniref:tail assembly protein n=1 Tax=Bordetella sp. LUAb4 TaxID=2843195 RepID=UPI001E5C0238|nr:tail assembly protein [Bordetella sp. LUAb4]
MNESLRTVRLYGKLGARFGRVHRLAVATTAEAIRALCALLPGFQRELATSKDRGVSYACFIGKQNIDERQLDKPVGDGDIRIAPVMAGAKNGGLLTTIIGAVLLVVSIFVPPLAGLALSMTLSGVMQMISPQQKGLSTRDNVDNGASYNFNGPINTTAQGNPVPLLYGEMITGSAVISAGLYAEDQV